MSPMRCLILLCLLAVPAAAQDTKIDRAVFDVLDEVHERGRVIFNDGDYAGGYRLYQGGLLVAQGMLGHRPELQKRITDRLAAADRQPTMERRGFLLHELIEDVRNEIKRSGKKGETLTVPPREVKPEKKPSGDVQEVKVGVVGRVIWQGQPVGGIDVAYIARGRWLPRTQSTRTSGQGVYALPAVGPGKYVVVIAGGANGPKLPERYASAKSSPLAVEVKAAGEKLDFVLQ